MFALINTNGATDIAIHIPQQGAEKSLPALIGMLERNSVFIKKSYGTLETVTPKTAILLGDTIREDHRDAELLITIPESENVIDDGFVLADPTVFVSNQKAADKASKEIDRLRTELAHVKAQLDDAREKLASLVGLSDED